MIYINVNYSIISMELCRERGEREEEGRGRIGEHEAKPI